MSEFEFTPKQYQAWDLLASGAQHIMLFGGSRSGKTFVLVAANIARALKAKNSRHCILRFRLGHIKSSIVLDTFPKVMRLCFPGEKADLNKSDLYAQFHNGSQIWFGGLDDKDRVEKILGNEYATLTFNECSQIPWASRNVALTRLAQQVTQKVEGQEHPLPLRAYYDENPPDKGHWTYQLFKLKRDPESKRPLNDPQNYASMQLNPRDNLSNLGDEYLNTLEALPGRLQKRFLEGEFRDMAPNALFTDEILDRWRVTDEQAPEMLKIVISVDPSGSDDTDNLDNDAIGIIVAGLGTDGIGYVLEDLTVKAGPATWGKVATDAYDRHLANTVVGEINFGGAMVNHVIQSARPRTPFRALTASRGKAVRAEPVSSLCETGKCRLVGFHRDLEEELCGFTTHGYTGELSPNRADAMIWAMSELFPNITRPEPPKKVVVVDRKGPAMRNDGLGWMG